MTLDCSPEVSAMLRTAARRPMVPSVERQGAPFLERRDIEALIPHRDPFLFIDGIVHVNRDTATIVCRYDLGRGASIVEGHFPGRSVWPGVLQVEAIGQAGLSLARLLGGAGANGNVPGLSLTHILGAEFVGPVTPAGQLEIVARVVPDGLFIVVVGQCLQHDVPCCAAAIRGIIEENQHES